MNLTLEGLIETIKKSKTSEEDRLLMTAIAKTAYMLGQEDTRKLYREVNEEINKSVDF